MARPSAKRPVGVSRLPLVALCVGGLAATLADVVAATRRDTSRVALRDREVRARLRRRGHDVARSGDAGGRDLTAVGADVEARVRESGATAVRVHAGVVGRARLDLRHEVASVRLRLRVLTLLLLTEEGRQGDRGKNADDEDHHEELDERKALLLAVDPLGKLPQHVSLLLGACGLARHLVQPPKVFWWQLGRLRRDEPPARAPGALRPRLATGLPLAPRH